MRLESLEIENIRSYSSARISFQEGVTLLEGDVGSGKSTLLYAIEFALFGLGDLKAGHLLRHGADEGKVKLSLEVEGKKITVQRNLERKNGPTRQAAGWIEEDGLRTEYSPEEMKKQMLNLLQFRENPSSRATSWIFRYAVFTPQEQMKEILSLRAEERLQTLRKAFGVEEYRNAQENALILQRSLREDARWLEGEASDLQDWRLKKEQVEEKLRELEASEKEQANIAEKARHEAERAEAVVRVAQAEHTQLEKIAAELPLLQNRRYETAREIQSAEKEGSMLDEKERKLATEEEYLSKRILEVPEGSEKRWAEASAKLKKLQAELGAAEQKAREHSSLETGTCPTCGQKISTDLHERIQRALLEYEGKSCERDAAQKEEEKARKELDLVQRQRVVQQRLSDLKQQKEDTTQRKAELGERMETLRKKSRDSDEEWAKKQEEYRRYNEVKAKLEGAEKERKTRQNAFQKAKETLAALGAQRKHLEESMRETLERIERKEKARAKHAALKERQAWLEEHFIPSVQNIEHHVLHRINDDFNSLFRKWFVQLLETQDLEAEVDESFTPVIEQQGFEQDYTALSGGEKSALALAYRLSLNTMVRQTTPSLKDNLLILDEPTDGFSKEQLSRMRTVLEEAGAKQVIIVSHERELEGFCDRVFSVQKEHGTSRIKST
ncbi:AAA family ATPase [Candidatus Micrarchaeota archaeon]|nr:AAA family ATPase [Candidatus Micrarchaeota archaeon]